MSIPTKEQLKARSKHLAKLLQEKHNLKVSHGHCLDVVAQLFGFKDWNTASAASPTTDEAPKPTAEDRYTPWLNALTQGFELSVEQPYVKERFHVGGVTADHSTEQGIISLPFVPRIDEQSRRVVLTLPTSNEVSTSENDLRVDNVKRRYRQREAWFAEKLGGKAEDLAKESKV